MTFWIFFCQAIAIYEAAIITMGTFCNPIVFYVAFRKRNDNPSFLFMMFLSMSDFVSMYWWNLTHVIEAFWSFDLQNYDVYYCRFMTFFQMVSLQASAWILVTISIERYISVVVVNWKNVFNSRKAYLCASIVVITILTLNIHILFTYGHERLIENSTIRVECYPTPDVPSSQIMGKWPKVNLFL